jgi:hypothetical protein
VELGFGRARVEVHGERDQERVRGREPDEGRKGMKEGSV